MTTDLIEAFMQLVEFRNFNRAADALCISQSALSHRLNLLEEEVGLTLITRSRGNRSLALTQAGIEFIAIADQWLRLEKSAQTFRADYYQRRLSVGTIESISFLFSPFYRDLIFRENEDRKLRLDKPSKVSKSTSASPLCSVPARISRLSRSSVSGTTSSATLTVPRPL